MKVRVLFFARARMLAGTPQAEFIVNTSVSTDDDLNRLQQQIIAEYPALTAIAGQLLWAVNGEYCDSSCRLAENAEVACFPPVSGG